MRSMKERRCNNVYTIDRGEFWTGDAFNGGDGGRYLCSYLQDHERWIDTIDDYGLSYPSYTEDVEKNLINGATVKVQKEIDKFPQTKELEVFGEAVIGHPAEEILKAQTEKGIDLIVIASLGRTGIAKYLIGGVARNVLKGSKCPVLLTK